MRRCVACGLLCIASLVVGGCASGHSQGTPPVAYADRTPGPPRALVAHLTHPVLQAGQTCPTTHPNAAKVKPPGGLRSALNGEIHGVYGDGVLWAVIPTWRHTVSRYRGWYVLKVAWWSQVSGPLHIAARRIDRHSATLGHGDIAQGNSITAQRIEPTNIAIPTVGCWQIAGSVGDRVLTWILDART